MKRRRVKEILFAPATGPAEVLMSVTMLAFGLPFLLWTRDFNQLPSYQPMVHLVSPRLWGMLMVITGLVRLFIVFGDSCTQRIVGCGVAMFLWLVLFLTILLGHPASPGVPVLAAFSIFELWTLARIRHMK